MKEFFEKSFRNKDNKLCIDFNELNEVCKLNEIPYVKGETNIDFGDDAFANIQCDEIIIPAYATLHGVNLQIGLPKSCRRLFEACSAKKVDLSNLESIENVTDTAEMFKDCTNLEKVDFGKNQAPNIKNAFGMFKNCINLKDIDLSSLNPVSLLNVGNMFSNCLKIESIDMSGWKCENVVLMSDMFERCCKLVQLKIQDFNTKNVETMKSMFSECSSLKNINAPNFKTDKVQDMSEMFYGCKNLTNINFGDNPLNTDNLKINLKMFHNCKAFLEDKLFSEKQDKKGQTSLFS